MNKLFPFMLLAALAFIAATPILSMFFPVLAPASAFAQDDDDSQGDNNNQGEDEDLD